jgi:hypothetical protein
MEYIITIHFEDHFLISEKRPLFRNAGTHYVKTSSAEVCYAAWSASRYTPLSSTASDEKIKYQVLANKATLPGGENCKMTNYIYTLYEGKRGCYGVFLVCGPLAEYLAEKLKRGPTKYYRLNIKIWKLCFT